MMAQIDITGRRFGRLVAMNRIGGDKRGRWLCRCDCGNEKPITRDHLKSGRSRSCGCIHLGGFTWEKLESKIERIPECGCWIWMGVLGYGTGYGVTSRGYKRMSVHRVVWELRHGPPANNLFVLHRCDVRSCVNPDHLFLGTAKDNFYDALSKGRITLPIRKKQGP